MPPKKKQDVAPPESVEDEIVNIIEEKEKSKSESSKTAPLTKPADNKASKINAPDGAADARDAAHLKDAWAALNSYFDEDPYFLTRHHIDSYDDFLDHGIHKVIQSMNPITMIKDDEMGGHRIVVDVYVAEDGVMLDRPTLVEEQDKGALRPLFPCEARLKDLTYSIRVYADVRIVYSVDGEPLGDPVKLPDRVCLGAVPLLLHSRHCLLHGLPASALREVGECPFDQGGYFVVDGKEKVIISKEDFVQNRLYVEEIRDSAGGADKDAIAVGKMRCTSPVDSFPRTTRVRVRSPNASTRPGVLTVEIDHLGRANDPSTHEQVPLFVMFRALGVESDRAIVQHIVYDVDAAEEADIVDFLRASVVDASSKGIFTQKAAIDSLAPGTKYKTVEDVKRTIVDNLYPNAGDKFASKALLLGHVARKVIRAALGKETILDRDDYTNKRVRLTGALMRDLFRDIYYRMRDMFSRRLDAEFLAGPWRNGAMGDLRNVRVLVNPTNITAMIQQAILTDGMRKSFKGAWGAPEQEGLDAVGGDDAKEEENVVQDLNRMSYLTYVSHVRRVNNPIDRSVKLAAPHRMLPSQWGSVCPVESPDGPNIGLLKHLAVACSLVTSDADPKPLRQHLISTGLAVGLSRFEVASASPLGDDALVQLHRAIKVYFDDTWSCVTFDPPALVQHVRSMRRRGLIPMHTSVAWNVIEGELHIHMDAGRCCRPLMRVVKRSVVDLGAALRKSQSSKSQSSQSQSYADLLLKENEHGERLTKWRSLFVGSEDDEIPLEMVDVEELRTLMVALWPSDLERRKHVEFTHCELHPTLILSATTSTYPLLNHNNAAYNVLCLAQFKQALGVYTTSFARRMDTLGCVMNSPQRPLFGTNFADRLCDGRHAHGQNLVVAIMCYTGYNQEDAIILNKDSVERGLFRVTVYKTHKFEESEASEDVGPDGELITSATLFGNPMDVEASGKGVVSGVDADVGYGKLDRHGFPKQNARIRERDIILGMMEMQQKTANNNKGSSSAAKIEYQTGGAAGAAVATPIKKSKKKENDDDGMMESSWIDRSVMAGRGQMGFVDKVLVYPAPPSAFGGGGRMSEGARGGTGPRLCKIRMRQTRSPTLGDKLASRFGQKGVCGILVPSRDMPYTHESGIVPDLIINPMGFPKRMTVTHLLEVLIAKAGAMTGTRFNASTFEPADIVREASDALESMGLHRNGEEVMYNGRTGEQIPADVYIGSNYYGRLKHMTQDKYQYRAKGRLNAIVRQPVKSENESGGLRIGEMEQNALIAHGLGSFVKESMMDRSDRYRNVIDARTGVPAQTPVEPYKSIRRDDGRDGVPGGFATVETPYAMKLMQQELQGLHVEMKFVDIDDPTGAPRDMPWSGNRRGDDRFESWSRPGSDRGGDDSDDEQDVFEEGGEKNDKDDDDDDEQESEPDSERADDGAEDNDFDVDEGDVMDEGRDEDEIST